MIASSSIATPANHELVWGTTAFTTVTIFPREQNGQTPFGSKRGERDQEGMQIMNSATGGGIGLTQLTSHPSTERYPDWSPDGTKIAFTAGDASGGYTDIYVINAPYGGATNGGGEFERREGGTPLGRGTSGTPTPEVPPHPQIAPSPTPDTSPF